MNARLSHQPGEVLLARYRILELVKTGGMGSVYKAQDEAQHVLCAIKECDLLDDPRKRQISRSEALAAFQAECRLLASLNHPGIPTGEAFSLSLPPFAVCLQCGRQLEPQASTCPLCCSSPSSLYYRPQLIDSRHYLRMNFIEGHDLTQISKSWSKPLTQSQFNLLVSYFSRLAEILAYLHDQQFVHRDLKPDNIRISPSGALFLLDYGLLEKTGSNPSRRLLPGQQLGTPGYAAPEQAAQPPQLANDLYAFAISFLSLACGLDPGNPAELARLTRSDSKLLVPFMPPAIAAHLRKSLHPNPRHRPSIHSWLSVLTPTIPLSRNDMGARLDRLRASTADLSQKSLAQAQQALRGPRASRWLVLIAALLLGLSAWYFLNGPEPQTYRAKPKRHARIYSAMIEKKAIRTLVGNESLLLIYPDPKNKGRWLEVQQIGEKAFSGFIQRDDVTFMVEDEVQAP